MIVPSMTKDELVKELSLDKDWVDGRVYGIDQKYKKKIMKVRGHEVLAVTNYTTPRNNFVTVVWRATYVDRRTTILTAVPYFRYMTVRGYQYIMLMCHGKHSYTPLIYTSHCIDRMKERIGMDFRQYIIQSEAQDNGGMFMDDYVYNGKQTKGLVFPNYGMFILDEATWGYAAVTFISKEQQGDVQNEITSEYERQRHMYNLRYENNIREQIRKNESGIFNLV